MPSEFDVVDVFVGKFGSKKALAAYLEESFDEDEAEEDAPISAFAKDLGQGFYDTDLLESAFRKSAKSLDDLCEEMSESNFWLPPARAAFLASGLDQPNTVILAFGETLDTPTSVIGPNYQLHHLGRFRRV